MSNVLFVGGTGQISLPCVEKAVAAGHKVTVFNRGKTEVPLPAGVTTIVGDMKDPAAYQALAKNRYDVVCQFMVFTPNQMAEDIKVFTGQTMSRRGDPSAVATATVAVPTPAQPVEVVPRFTG